MIEGLENLLKGDNHNPAPTAADPAPVAPVNPVEEPLASTEQPAADPAPVAPVNPGPLPQAPAGPSIEALQARIAELEKALSMQPQLDPFIENLVSTYLSGGDISPYLSAKTTDYNKMSDEEIYRIRLRKQYESVDDQTFEYLYAAKIKQFIPDPDSASESEVLTGKALLKAETMQFREELKKEQEKFLSPVTPQIQKEELQKIEQGIYQDAATVSLLSTQKLEVKVGDTVVNVGVNDPRVMIASTLDPQEHFFGNFMNAETRKPDLQKWYEVVAFANNPELFKKLLFDAGVSNGKKSITNVLVNPDDPNKKSAPGQVATTLLDAFAQAAKRIN